MFPALQADSLPSEPPEKSQVANGFQYFALARVMIISILIGIKYTWIHTPALPLSSCMTLGKCELSELQFLCQ